MAKTTEFERSENTIDQILKERIASKQKLFQSHYTEFFQMVLLIQGFNSIEPNQHWFIAVFNVKAAVKSIALISLPQQSLAGSNQFCITAWFWVLKQVPASK